MTRTDKTTYWHAVQDNRLFVIRGIAAHASFRELREKIPAITFKQLRASLVRFTEPSQPFRDKLILDF